MKSGKTIFHVPADVTGNIDYLTMTTESTEAENRRQEWNFQSTLSEIVNNQPKSIEDINRCISVKLDQSILEATFSKQKTKTMRLLRNDEEEMERRPVMMNEYQRKLQLLKNRFGYLDYQGQVITSQQAKALSKQFGWSVGAIYFEFNNRNQSPANSLPQGDTFECKFDSERHPTIQQMIDLAEEMNVSYGYVFWRFERLRGLRNERCLRGDTCWRINQYLLRTDPMPGIVTNSDRENMLVEFQKLMGKDDVQGLMIGHFHLIMDSTNLTETVIQTEFDAYKFYKCKSKKFTNLPQPAVKEFNVEEAVACADSAEPFINSRMEIQFDHDYLPVEYSPELKVHFKSRIFEDSQFEANNRHPEIRELINISRVFDVPYSQIFKRFEELRDIHNDLCTENDPCQKVQKFISRSQEGNGVLDEKNTAIMQQEFERYGTLDLALLHLLMEKTDLPMLTIENQYYIWMFRNAQK